MSTSYSQFISSNVDKSPLNIILQQITGTVWVEVLPYCALNVLVTILVYVFKDSAGISYFFSAQGHAFMSLIVSFLVVQKINLAFDRYMNARVLVGKALMGCRDLHQLAMTLSALDESSQGVRWRSAVRETVRNHGVR
jgi:predicted membrane chloride channel (bestrophin family)